MKERSTGIPDPGNPKEFYRTSKKTQFFTSQVLLQRLFIQIAFRQNLHTLDSFNFSTKSFG